MIAWVKEWLAEVWADAVDVWHGRMPGGEVEP
jgi:hypothetical protein